MVVVVVFVVTVVTVVVVVVVVFVVVRIEPKETVPLGQVILVPSPQLEAFGLAGARYDEPSP